MFTLRGVVRGTSITHPLREGTTIAGRTGTCDLVLDPPSVSRQHAQFRVHGGACFVSDLGSRSGTIVDGAPITAETRVAPGARIELGDVILWLDAEPDEGVALEAEEPEEGARGHTIIHEMTALVPASQPVVAAERLLTLLAEIGRTLVSVQPFPEVLARVVGLTFSVLPNDRAVLLLGDARTPGEMRAAVALSRDGSVPAETRITRTIVRHVVEQRAAVVVDDVATDSRFARAQSLGLVASSSMCAPLWNRAEVIGVLFVDAPGMGRFSRADLEVFTALANYAAVAIEQARAAERLAEEARRRQRLERYHSPAVIERILHGGDEAPAQMIAEETDLTVLFCDVAGFTTLCERLPPVEVVLLLNAFFSRMCEVVFEFEGTLDKFIGDELMVVFNAPFRQPDHALRAARTALGLRRALAQFNAERPEMPLEVRIAIASGPGMAGDIGTPQRRDFTVLGDVVNTAARIKATVARPGEILLADTTWNQLGDRLPGVGIGSVSLRGRRAQIEVYRLADGG